MDLGPARALVTGLALPVTGADAALPSGRHLLHGVKALICNPLLKQAGVLSLNVGLFLGPALQKDLKSFKTFTSLFKERDKQLQISLWIFFGDYYFFFE